MAENLQLTSRPRQTLLSQLPDSLNINPILTPINPNGEHRIIIKETKVGGVSANSQDMLNHHLPMIKQKLLEPNFNLTFYKKELWREKFKLDEATAYGLSLLIPDIYRPPLIELGQIEKPHLGLYLWGHSGQGRTTIGKLLSKQCLYSLFLSETGFDSDVGVLYALSKANKDVLLIGSDIGSAVKGLKDWQRKLPAMVVNFIWDGYDVRVTKGEGMIEAKNEGVSFYGGGNFLLGRREFSVKDVSRIIQKKLESGKDRNIALMVRAYRDTARLNELAHPFLLYTHYLNALVIQGKVRTGIFDGRPVRIEVNENLTKRIAGHILRNWIPQLTFGKGDDQIWNEMESYEEQLEGVSDDVNAILRIRTMASMIVRDTTIDNLLLRPYTIENGVIKVSAIEEDLIPFQAIMNRQFWDMKRFEFKQFVAYPKITPIQFVPEEYFCQILKERREPLSVQVLWTIAKEEIVEEGGLMTEEQFHDLYSNSGCLSESNKLRTIIDRLERLPNILKIGGGMGRIVKFQYHESQN